MMRFISAMTPPVTPPQRADGPRQPCKPVGGAGRRQEASQ